MSIDPPGRVYTLKQAVTSPTGSLSQSVADAKGLM